jgi:hypothetical protein
LGGSPTLVPDVPIAVIFLVIYLIFGVIHIKIFKSNKHRGHKFIFNGAILGKLVNIRQATVTVPANISQVFARSGSSPCLCG